MFNIGPFELMVLAIVALLVLGPEKLPGFVRDAARMLRTLRELATGAREQLREELGPEFADVDFRNLNPRTAITRAVFGDEPPDLQKYNPRNFDARASARDLLYGREDEPTDGPVSMTKTANGASANGHSANGASANGHSANGASANGHSANGAAGRPRPRPRPQTPPSGGGYDSDAT